MDIETNMPHVVPDDSDDDEGDDPSHKNERSQLKFTEKGGGVIGPGMTANNKGGGGVIGGGGRGLLHRLKMALNCKMQVTHKPENSNAQS